MISIRWKQTEEGEGEKQFKCSQMNLQCQVYFIDHEGKPKFISNNVLSE